MNPRRRFLRKLLASTPAIALPALAAPYARLEGTLPPSSADPAIENQATQDLAATMQHVLAAELNDPSPAAIEVPFLLDVGFKWSPPSRAAASIRTIVAYSFGNRLPTTASAAPEPGPVNAELAETVYRLYERSSAAIFAQWEIAHILKTRYPRLEVTSIEPVTGPDGKVVYLSTDGLAEAVVTRAKQPAALGTVGVVAHRDHAKRCVLTSRDRGMDAFVAADLPLPVTYDPQSGQPWTRRRDLYLLHDMAAQFMRLRAREIARAS